MSETLDLFKTALGLGEPWRVTRSDFDVVQGRLDLYLDFLRGARFACAVPGCDQGSCPVHDTEDKTWRHMDFFQYKAFLHARVPRTRCPEHGVHLVEVVWARPESGFTLLFEALLIEFATAMPVARVAAMTREHDTRIWRVLEHHVAVQREKLSFAVVRRVGMDETSARKGQDYVTTFMDLDARGPFARQPPGRRPDRSHLSSRTRPAPSSRGHQYLGCGRQCSVKIGVAPDSGF